ncbi:MAG TPA: hypothetical protein VHX37_11420 [Acidobacteriaceae bacterium]|jgi:hypothetical protein|nr:hypothetical protein [Acidobacteriaceae bacterium]
MPALTIATAPVLFALLALAPLPAGPPATTTFPGLTVTVTLSPRARQTLLARRETVIVSAEITAFPQPGVSRKFLDGEGQLDLGNATTEILPGRSGLFKTFSLSAAPLRRVDKRGPQLLINVYSGRKSSPDNLIDCGIYEGPLSAVENKTIPIACKLIGE